MGVFGKAYYHIWNIGFIEASINAIIKSQAAELEVHWVSHHFKDRFFADPFILSVDNDSIKVLVEEFPFFEKRGMISLLIIDKKTYELIEKRSVLKQPFHMSYPFIMRKYNGDLWVAPEASQSGFLFYYTFNDETMVLENQRVLIPEPLLDATIIDYNGLWWLFCTKKGENSNKELFIYYADSPEGPWKSHESNPVVQNLSMARPAGYLVKDGNDLYRIIQKCDKSYGEAVNVSRVQQLTTTEFQEAFLKELHVHGNEYTSGFHTLNSYGDITVVDGLKSVFAPFRRITFEIKNILQK